MNWNNTRHFYTLWLDIWGYIRISEVIAVSHVDFYLKKKTKTTNKHILEVKAIQIIHCCGEGVKSIQQWNYTQTFVQKTIDNNYLIALERIQQCRELRTREPNSTNEYLEFAANLVHYTYLKFTQNNLVIIPPQEKKNTCISLLLSYLHTPPENLHNFNNAT